VNDNRLSKRKLVRQSVAERILSQKNPAFIFVSFISSKQDFDQKTVGLLLPVHRATNSDLLTLVKKKVN